MIATNLLLGFGFSIIANFTNVVQLPDEEVPKTIDDIQRYVVSGPPPVPPTHLYIAHRRGTEFWMRDGAVYRFCSPRSFFQLQDPSQIPKFLGAARLTSKEVVELAVVASVAVVDILYDKLDSKLLPPTETNANLSRKTLKALHEKSPKTTEPRNALPSPFLLPRSQS